MYQLYIPLPHTAYITFSHMYVSNTNIPPPHTTTTHTIYMYIITRLHHMFQAFSAVLFKSAVLVWSWGRLVSMTTTLLRIFYRNTFASDLGTLDFGEASKDSVHPHHPVLLLAGHRSGSVDQRQTTPSSERSATEGRRRGNIIK